MMTNQGIRTNRNYLVEEIHGKEVVRQGNTDGSKDGQGKTGIKAGLTGFIMSPHVTQRVEDRDHPQRGGDHGKDHGEAVRPQGNRESR